MNNEQSGALQVSEPTPEQDIYDLEQEFKYLGEENYYLKQELKNLEDNYNLEQEFKYLEDISDVEEEEFFMDFTKENIALYMTLLKMFPKACLEQLKIMRACTPLKYYDPELNRYSASSSERSPPEYRRFVSAREDSSELNRYAASSSELNRYAASSSERSPPEDRPFESARDDDSSELNRDSFEDRLGLSDEMKSYLETLRSLSESAPDEETKQLYSKIEKTYLREKYDNLQYQECLREIIGYFDSLLKPGVEFLSKGISRKAAEKWKQHREAGAKSNLRHLRFEEPYDFNNFMKD